MRRRMNSAWTSCSRSTPTKLIMLGVSMYPYIFPFGSTIQGGLNVCETNITAKILLSYCSLFAYHLLIPRWSGRPGTQIIGRWRICFRRTKPKPWWCMLVLCMYRITGVSNLSHFRGTWCLFQLYSKLRLYLFFLYVFMRFLGTGALCGGEHFPSIIFLREDPVLQWLREKCCQQFQTLCYLSSDSTQNGQTQYHHDKHYVTFRDRHYSASESLHLIGGIHVIT